MRANEEVFGKWQWKIGGEKGYSKDLNTAIAVITGSKQKSPKKAKDTDIIIDNAWSEKHTENWKKVDKDRIIENES